MEFGYGGELSAAQPRWPSSYGTKRPLVATKFSRHGEISQLLANIIYQQAVVVNVLRAGDPTKTRISAMVSAVCRCEIDDFALLSFRPRMYIVLFMDVDKQQERAEKACNKKTFTFKTTRLKFEPFKMNLHSVINPLHQRVILALEGVPPKSWNKQAITELIDNSFMVEKLYGVHHIQDLSVFKLAAWTTDCDVIPKANSWNIETANVSWNHNAALSMILVHVEKLFDYADEDSGSDSDDELLRQYEQEKPRLPVVKTFTWVSCQIDLDNGPIEGGSLAMRPRRLPLEFRRLGRQQSSS